MFDSLIDQRINNFDKLIEFVEDNDIDFAPFSKTNQALNSNDELKKFVTPHTVLSSKFTEITDYFANTNNSNVLYFQNRNLIISKRMYTTSTDLSDRGRLWWQQFYFEDFISHKNCFNLKYPDPSKTADENWQEISNNFKIFEDYFESAFNNYKPLLTIQYLDLNYQDLNLQASDIIPFSKVKALSFSIGPDLVSNLFTYKARSFNYLFTVEWVD